MNDIENAVNDPTMNKLVNALLDGDQVQAVNRARELLESGVGLQEIVTDGVEAAMVRLDAKCTVEQFNLLEIMLSGRASMAVMKEIYPPNMLPLSTKGTVVICALEGDVHDLGKNIFKMVLTMSGYRVVDCGKDCPIEKLIDAAEESASVAIGISGLITAIIPQVRQLREKAARRGLGQIPLLAGGAALKQASAESLNVDFVAQSAFDGLHYLDRLTGGINEQS
jgi:methanogenic corrinoid protein MtbC1